MYPYQIIALYSHILVHICNELKQINVWRSTDIDTTTL